MQNWYSLEHLNRGNRTYTTNGAYNVLYTQVLILYYITLLLSSSDGGIAEKAFRDFRPLCSRCCRHRSPATPAWETRYAATPPPSLVRVAVIDHILAGQTASARSSHDGPFIKRGRAHLLTMYYTYMCAVCTRDDDKMRLVITRLLYTLYVLYEYVHEHILFFSSPRFALLYLISRCILLYIRIIARRYTVRKYTNWYSNMMHTIRNSCVRISIALSGTTVTIRVRDLKNK